jgi:hypothetical protein
MFVGNAVGFRVSIIVRLKELERIAFRAWLSAGIALSGRDFGEMEDEALLLFVAAEIDKQGEEIGMFGMASPRNARMKVVMSSPTSWAMV